MKAAVFTSFRGSITIEDVPDPSPTPTGVVIRVEATGICRSDWHGWMGHDAEITLPHVPGHELAGVIEALGHEVDHWSVGDRVTVPFICSCGQCRDCRDGHGEVCSRQYQPGFSGWGSFAEFVMIEFAASNLIALPSDLGFVTAASLGCRFSTAWRALVHQAQVQPGEWVAIHGCGGVGLSAIMIAQALGARAIGIDLDDEKLACARDLGAEHTLNASAAEDVPSAIRALTHGGAQVSLDALGSLPTCLNSIESLRPCGRHVQVGLMTADATRAPVPWDRIVAQEITLHGSHGMSARHYPELMTMVAEGRLDPARLVAQTLRLAEAPNALTGESAFAQAGITVIDRFTT